ncbi:MAG: TetR/AcrR family transcriptional regulator [Anaerolineales bacterium]|nr:TetR/AcrR family transcriptional regulator [Anaerolineales bacterium]
MPLKDTIVHESRKLFSLNGFLSTGINDIIAAAGTSKGGFYNLFSSKEELFYAVLAESQKLWREKVLNSTNEINSPTDKIIKIFINYRENYLKDFENFPGGCIFITFSIELDDARPHLMKEVNKGFEGFKTLLINLLDEAKDVDELPESINLDSIAQILFAGMLGASVLYGVEKDEQTLDRSIDALIEYIYLLRDEHMHKQFK